MKVIFGIRDLFALVGSGIALLGASGCDDDRSTSAIEPNSPPRVERRYSPPNQPLEDLKKDIKPPVVVKPSTPATDATSPASPKRELP